MQLVSKKEMNIYRIFDCIDPVHCKKYFFAYFYYFYFIRVYF